MDDFSKPRLQPCQSEAIHGELVTETFAYDAGRQVTVYLPPIPPEVIVFAADGQMISQWGKFLEAADVPSCMIVGVHRVADETLRLHEYSPNFNPERFAAHERFFVEDVGTWTRSRFGECQLLLRALQNLGQRPRCPGNRVHFIEHPALTTADEIEAYLLVPVDVCELRGYGLVVRPLVRTCDRDILDSPILTIDPEENFQAADLAFRLALIVTE